MRLPKFSLVVWTIAFIGIICGLLALALGPYGCDSAGIKAERDAQAALVQDVALLKAHAERDVSFWGGFANNWKVIVGSAAPAAAAAGLGGWKLGKRKK